MEPCAWGGFSPAKKDLHVTTGARLKKLKRCTLVASKANLLVLGYIKRATVGQSWEAIVPPTSVLVMLRTDYYIQAPQFKRDVKTGSRGLQ